MSEPPLRVAVLSPQPVVAEGLRAILAPARDRVQLVELDYDEPEPDVVLYDALSLLRGDTTDLDILVGKTAAAVLVVSRDLRPGLAAEALAAGADGHISLSADRDDILEALESAATGWSVGDAGDSPVVGSRDSTTGRALVGGDRGLTVREVQVLTLVGQGMSERGDRPRPPSQPEHREVLHQDRLPQDRRHQARRGDRLGHHPRPRREPEPLTNADPSLVDAPQRRPVAC